MMVCLCYHAGKNKIEPWWSTCNLFMIFKVYNHYQMFLHINSVDIRSLALDFDIRVMKQVINLVSTLIKINK